MTDAQVMKARKAREQAFKKAFPGAKVEVTAAALPEGNQNKVLGYMVNITRGKVQASMRLGADTPVAQAIDELRPVMAQNAQGGSC